MALLALVRSDNSADVLALSAVLAVSLAAAGRLLEAFRRTPSGFPTPSDESVGARPAR